jgi:uncharacterized protein YndB with AHSA1/START domain
MSVEHRTVRVEREYAHPPSRVFAAWADPDTKRHWFTLDLRPGDEWWMDFRVGGVERYRSPRVSYDGRYCDIVPEERIILTTEVSLDGRRSSVTVNTAHFESTPGGTRLAVVDQAVFLDGLETAESRVSGISRQLDDLGVWLARR